MRPDDASATRSTALRRLALGMSIAQTASEKTQKEVAERCGISTAYLSKMLSGRKNPSQAILEKFAHAVGLRIGQIYDLGDQALERETARERHLALERVAVERTAATLADAAVHLDDAGLRWLIRTLQDLQRDRQKERESMPRGA